MKIYLAIGGSDKVRGFVEKYDLGWCIAPDNARDPKGVSYFCDNGAFHAWKHGTVWSANRLQTLLKRYPNYNFVVAPDIVCGGESSLKRSIEYIGKIPGNLYLAVQDGMTAKMVTDILDQYLGAFAGLFIGGSISWKFQTARMWADIAHLYKMKCHAGRVGTWKGLIHMHYSGIDSVDSSTASRNGNDTNIRKYYDHLKNQRKL